MVLKEDFQWDILDTYFSKGTINNKTSQLIKHQIDSYNKFINTTLLQIISGFNPISINTTNKNNDLDNNILKIYLNVIQPSLSKPTYQLPDGSTSIMTPYIARMNNLTYSSSLYVNVHIIIELLNEDGIPTKIDKYVNNVYIGKIPIMVRSEACILSQIPGIGDDNNNECRYDFGGYFIVNGNEKVLIMQDRINENDTLVFVPNNNNDGIYAEIRSMSDSSYLPPKTTSLNMIGKLNHMGRNIRLNTSFLRCEIPVFVMFRALGIISDKEIIEHIVYDLDNKDNQRIISQLMACCEDACDIHTQEQAEEYLIKNMTGVNKNTANAIKILRDNITNDFLGHVGKNYRRKALYLGYMICKMIRIYLEYDDYDNRDSYMNKRIDSPGVLMSNLFRQCYGKMTKEIKGLIERELNLWRANHSCLTTDIISDNNIHRYFKHSLLESWLKYSLSTGNWGIKSIGSFQNIKQGVSQVLNRMSYASTLSHLRRISTSMEKNGKLVQPRKLDNSQINMICPAETPEGASVGLVKNIALSTNISIAMNSTHIRHLLIELGTHIYDDSYSYMNDNNNTNNEKWYIESDAIKNSRNKASNFLKEMGNPSNVYVQINGDIIGYHTNPIELYKTLKHYKRCGIIYPMTSIVWNILKRGIIISTEAGRMYRPLLIVDYDETTKKSELRIIKILKEKNITWNEFIKDKSFDYLISPNNNDNEEGIIEYLDCNEINHSMIAMNYQELYKTPKGNTMPIHYTNCEIHPSLMNGILGVNIPFSDHNQSPRNCYQCLNEYEIVLLSNGNKKFIKDINIGDEIVCFNPITMTTSFSSVINHYNRITNKIVYNIKILSGRSITATYDHKFITNQGWIQVKDFDDTIKLGILINPNPNYINNINKENCNILNNDIDNNFIEYLTSINLYPLTNDNYYMSIIARLAGYYFNNKFNFPSKIDEEKFNNDAITIGFINGIYDIRLELFLNYINVNINNWIFKCSSLIKREYISGYFSYNYQYTNSNIIKNIISEFELPFEWELLNDNSIKANYYSKIGINYNYKKLNDIALIYEYNQFKLENYRNDIKLPDYSFTEFSNLIDIKGNLMFIPFLNKFINTNNRISDLTIANSDFHSFIGGDGFAVSNCAMGKQALGIYMSNFNSRTDTMGNIINYPQKPIVSTRLSKYTYNNELPSGVNAIVAIMTHTGFNQEDSVMINKSALDRGLFTSTYYKVFRDQCTKNHSSGEEEIFVNPKNLCVGKPYSYDKLTDDGFITKNTYVDNGDIIVGKVMPRKANGKITYQDNSIYMKSNDDGYIDMNYVGTNSEGYKFCKIRIRKNRKPEIGDKVASRSAQKGSIGMIYEHKDMPFTKDGIVPDIIINPHAIPSRMTMAQLMECIMGKVSCSIGAYGDSTPFTNCTVEYIADNLEKTGLEKYGNEIMYNGRTGEQIKTEIFIGPTYYQRLKHMVSDKIHCTLSGHEVLTAKCWKDISEITMDDEIATLKDGKLVYEKPLEVFHYPNYKGKIYRIKNQAIELDVTINHRMYISSCHTRKRVWSDYYLEKAENIVGKMVKYKRNADWDADDYQFILPAFENYEEKIVDMKSWLIFFGIWMAEGCAHNGKRNNVYTISTCVHKQRVKDVLYDAINKLGYYYKINNNVLIITDKQLHAYMAPLSVGAPNKYLPEWVWKLSKEQAQLLVYSMQLGDGSFNRKTSSSIYYTSSVKLSDDFMKLLLHAGWSGMKTIHIKAGENKVKIRGKDVCNNYDIWRISVIKSKNEPCVNHGHHKEQKIQEEYVYDYEGSVYCLSVPSEVFYIRKNGKPVWTGNSRGSNGPIVMLTRQCSEGRARGGGLRLGEMERDCFIGHGSALFLKEKMLDCADNYRVFICKSCGMIANVNPDKNIYKCNYCKNATDIVQIRIPYAFKLLTQELNTMNVIMRYICN
jgi:DNA-directed RNA polymerase beta subunit